MKFPPEESMILLVAAIDGGTFSVTDNGITITLPAYPGRPQPVDAWKLQHLEDREWIVIGETVTVTEKGRYAARRYADKLFGRTRRAYDLGIVLPSL